MKKILFLAISLILLAGLFVGCARKDAAVELEMFYYKQENSEGLYKLIAAFTEETGIKITPFIIANDADATMSTRAAQGKLPDILQMQSYARVQEYASNGFILDLTDQPVLGQVLDAAKPAVTYNGRQFGLPMDFAGIGIIYNKDIFNQFNLAPPTTARELERVAATLKANGVLPFAGLLAENWSAGHFITLVHTALLVGEKNIPVDTFIADMNAGATSWGVVDTDKLFRTMDFYLNNMDPKAAEWNWNEQQAAFAQGQAAMMVQGLWSYGAAIATNPELNCGFIPYPVFNDASLNKMYADIDSCFVVSAQSSPAKQEAALKFINWLSSPVAQKIWIEDYKLVPAFKGADLSAMKQPFQDLLASVSANGAYPWAFSMYPTAAFEDAAKNGAQQYMFRRMSAEQVVAEIDRTWAAAAAR